ncbi:MAG: transposase [Acidobacteriota bacterium]
MTIIRNIFFLNECLLAKVLFEVPEHDAPRIELFGIIPLQYNSSQTPDGNLSKGMRQLNGVYTQYFNRKDHRVGHIFQGRYMSILIEKKSYLLEVRRYVVLNPVRAKAVKKPEDWKWSSYRGTAGMEKPHKCLRPDWILGQFGAKRRQAEKNYREFVVAGIQEKGIWKEVRGQSALVKGYSLKNFSPTSRRMRTQKRFRGGKGTQIGQRYQRYSPMGSTLPNK